MVERLRQLLVDPNYSSDVRKRLRDVPALNRNACSMGYGNTCMTNSDDEQSHTPSDQGLLLQCTEGLSQRGNKAMDVRETVV